MFILESFARAGWPRSRMLHAPYGIPLPAEGARAPRPAGPLRVGFLGSIVPAKGLQVLVRAHRAVPRGAMRLSIHGNTAADPAYWAAVRRELVRGETEVAGPYMPDDVYTVLAHLDVVVVPSLWYENAPIVIAEARAAGVPVVASDLGGMAELVAEGRAGARFEPGNAADLARVLTGFAGDREALARSAAGILPPRSVMADAQSLLDLYGSAREPKETGR
jgi:glycosyltransferase involved in cell wall biosynthesis